MARSAVAASLAWPGRGRRLLFMATAVIRPNVVKPRILKELDKNCSYLNVIDFTLRHTWDNQLLMLEYRWRFVSVQLSNKFLCGLFTIFTTENKQRVTAWADAILHLLYQSAPCSIYPKSRDRHRKFCNYLMRSKYLFIWTDNSA